MVRHRWQVGDVGIWDNRSAAHYANRDYTETRVMRRITLRGDRPVGPRQASEAARQRREAARTRDLTALLQQRPELAGVYLPADSTAETARWCV